jgi:hypothetical protein
MLKTYRQHINESEESTELPKVFVPRNVEGRTTKHFKQLLEKVKKNPIIENIDISTTIIPDGFIFPKCIVTDGINAEFCQNLTPEFFQNITINRNALGFVTWGASLDFPKYFTKKDIEKTLSYLTIVKDSYVTIYRALHSDEEEYEWAKQEFLLNLDEEAADPDDPFMERLFDSENRLVLVGIIKTNGTVELFISNYA